MTELEKLERTVRVAMENALKAIRITEQNLERARMGILEIQSKKPDLKVVK